MFRKIIFFIFVAIFGIYVYFHLGDLKDIAEAIRQGKTTWITFAFLIEIFFYFIYILIFREAFALVGLKRSVKEMAPLVLGAFFVNIFAPAAGHAGTVLFAEDARERKESMSKAVIGVIITFFAIYLALIAFLVIAMFNLRLIGELGYGEIIAAVVFLVMTLAPVLAVWAGHFRPDVLQRILNFIYRFQVRIQKFFRPKKEAAKNWVETSVKEISEAAASVGNNLKKSFRVAVLALIGHMLNITCLLIIFFALGIKLKYSAAITGYAFGEVARVISPQPEGVGAVEFTMVLLFSLFGVTPLVATTAVIIFRAFNVWFPMSVGFLYLRTLKSFQD